MPLYRTSKKESFITCVADFVLDNFKDNLADIKVILPNGYLCNYLQKIIIDKIGTTILPSIIPVINITSEKDETFKIPHEQIGKITALEERMMLAQIIHSYDKLGYNLTQSLALSSSLARLFFEFEANNVDLNILKNIPILEQAQHWHFIYDFLEFAYQNLQQKIIDTKKLSPAHHHKLMLNAELNRVKDSRVLIIAGVIGNNQITQDFITKVASLENGHVILPPMPSYELKPFDFKPENPFYNLAKLIKPICTKFLDLPLLDTEDPSILDNLLAEGIGHHGLKPIYSFFEFPHTLNEAEYIALECVDQVAKNPKAKIAILITNEKTKNYFTAKLVKYELEFTDLIDDNILELPLTTLILEIAENICKSFSLKDFISLISHPLVINDEVIKLKKLIAKENRFASNIEDVEKLLQTNRHCEKASLHANVAIWGGYDGHYSQPPEIATPLPEARNDVLSPSASCNDDDLEKLLTLCQSLHITNYNFHAILRQIIDIAQMLCPNLWHDSVNHKIAGALEEILNTPWLAKDLDSSNLESLPELIKSLLLGGKIRNEKKGGNIVICGPGDITLMNYDLLIYTNFAENSYPMPQFNSPWLNNQIASQLGLDSESARFGNTMYDFYLNLHNKKVLITRSIKTDNSGISLPSPFLLRLKHVLGVEATRHCEEPLGATWQSHEAWSNLVVSHGIAAVATLPRNDVVSNTISQIKLDNEFKSELAQVVLIREHKRDSKNSLGSFKNGKLYNIPFPSQISATDIEMLIRSPYNFYAKKILNLRIEQEIEDRPKLSEFGNFFHKIVELYTNDNSNSLEDYAKKLLASTIFPKQTQKFWQFKIEALAKDFIAFDNEQRNKSTKIYSEVRGEIEWDIAGTRIKIVAIADRIEQTEQNRAIILDYKTGAIPTKQDVLSGLSPQLIIEAIILLEGGFADIGKTIETESLIYVKINSSAPFISLTEIKITKDDILEHKEKIVQLLTYYIEAGEYPTLPNLMKYDDYWHLGRRE